MTEAVAAFVVRGDKNKLNELVSMIQRRPDLRLVLVKFGPPSDYFLIKRLREGEGVNGGFERKP